MAHVGAVLWGTANVIQGAGRGMPEMLDLSLARQLDGLWYNAGGRDNIRLHSLPPNRLCFEGHDGWLDIRQRGALAPLLDSSGGSRIDLAVLDLRQSAHRTPNVPGQLSIVVSGNDAPEVSLAVNGQVYRKHDEFSLTTRPDPPQPALQRLLGHYGDESSPLVVFERHGQLHALLEWAYYYPLLDLDAGQLPHYSRPEHSFAFPSSPTCRYAGQQLTFKWSHGECRAVSVTLNNDRTLPRIKVSVEEGGSLPLLSADTLKYSLDELRQRAMDSQPPSACVTDTEDQTRVDLVDLRTLSPSLRFDIRYATTNNFMGAAFYTTPGAFLQRPAAEALVRVHDKLQELGYGLLVHDAYRPWHVTKMFWDAAPPEKRIYVADPDKGSEHNRGCAVDLTLYSRATGDVAEMIGGYDEFSQRSHVNYPGGTSLQRWLRKLLRDAMESEGFAVYEYEWWHFDYRDVLRYPVLNFSLEDLCRSRPDRQPMGVFG